MSPNPIKQYIFLLFAIKDLFLLGPLTGLVFAQEKN